MSRRLASALPVLVALVAVERDVQACSPPLPSLTGSVPQSGGTYPANAPIVLQGYNLDLSQISAKIDGVDATIAPVADMNQAFRVSPEPQAGQKVTLTGKVCSSSTNCDLNLEFTASAADLDAPGAIDKVEFNVFDFEDSDPLIGSCSAPKYFAFFVDIAAKPSTSSAPEFWSVALVEPGDNTPVFSTVVARSGSDAQVLLSPYDKSLASKLPSGLCVEVRSVDLSGNKSEVKRVCSPCHFRKDSTKFDEFATPTEPVWTEADVVAGGACDSQGGGGAGGSGGSGQAGAAGEAGQAGEAGAAGQAGSAGQAGTAGAAGEAGKAGSAGQAAGNGGTPGSGSPGVSPTTTEEDSGCSVGRGASPSGALAVGLLGLLGLVRRRRNPRA